MISGFVNPSFVRRRIYSLVRSSYDQRTKDYMRRRIGQGMTKTEVIRCLKRYVAREVFEILLQTSQANQAKAP